MVICLLQKSYMQSLWHCRIAKGGGGGVLVRKSLGGCGHALDEDQLQISEL